MSEPTDAAAGMSGVDTPENKLLALYPNAFRALLKDHTTGRNIIWATDSYKDHGEGYAFNNEITPERITGAGDKGMVIQPRAVKTREEQLDRIKKRAEVFTPSWICNAQNNLIDEAWFGRRNVFNTEHPETNDWTPNEEFVTFPEGKDWRKYVHDLRMEITCGEAPYIVSRYDTTTGKEIPLEKRIGLLDRKLRIVSENVRNHKDWLNYAKKAVRSVYGFELQGDNLLLAREAVFCTFIDYHDHQFPEKRLNERSLLPVAHIIAWNLWQMDGLSFGIPGHTPKEALGNDLLAEETYNGLPSEERYCRIARWKKDNSSEPESTVKFVELVKEKKR